MKRSNTGLFIVIGFAAVLIIVTIVGARIVIGNIFGKPGTYDTEVVEEASAEMDMSVMTFNYADFNEIEVAGAWTINVRQGEDFAVTVHCPEGLKDLVMLRKRGERLCFEDVFRFRRLKTGSLKADITMPSLEKYEVDGAASVYISGFEQERLELEINGAASITGENNAVETLRVDLHGAGLVDFGGSETKNADVDIDGVGKVVLSISGGVLDGSIDGLGSIKYYGDISENRLDIDGLGSVKKVE